MQNTVGQPIDCVAPQKSYLAMGRCYSFVQTTEEDPGSHMDTESETNAVDFASNRRQCGRVTPTTFTTSKRI